jgi:membrane-associated protease RseP (regulator of RpoE activity)
MGKFLSLDFVGLLLFVVILFIVHEYGHYLAYRVLGYKAVVRKSFLAPGIDPQYTIKVTRAEGLLIALGGFMLSTIIIVIPLLLLEYKLWFVLLIGSVAGSVVDFIWALCMLFQKSIIISAK